MKVLYDYQAFSAQKAGGVSRYFIELLNEWQFRGAVQSELMAPFSTNLHLRDARRRGLGMARGLQIPLCWGPHPVLSIANRIAFFAGTLGRSWDIYHPTYYNLLCPSPHSRKKVVTIFDMTHERFPELFPAHDPTVKRKRKMLDVVDGIICISEATRRDLLELTGVPKDKTTVIPLATRISGTPTEPFSFPRPYWLYVGTRAKYKDFDVLLGALKSSKTFIETDVICFGGGGFSKDENQVLDKMGLTTRVHYLSGSDSLLRGIYENAIALVYPSRYEGFGLPPLEAMTVGCPVITADCSSLPEVVGCSGEKIPPGNVEALSVSMERILNSAEYRLSLRSAGRYQAMRFSWANTAAQTQKFYDKVLV